MEKEGDILFRDYDEGNLTESESKAFEDRLMNDPIFKSEFDNYELGKLAGERLLYNEARASVINAQSTELTNVQKNSNSRKVYLWIAGTAAAIILGLFSIFSLSSTIDTNEIYASNYDPPGISVNRSTQPSDSILNDLIHSYVLEEYSDVIVNYENLDSIHQIENTYKRMLAHAYINTNEENKALSILRQTSTTESRNEKILDQWYMGLVFLKFENLDSAQYYFEMVNEDLTFNYHDDTEEILRQIKKLRL